MTDAIDNLLNRLRRHSGPAIMDCQCNSRLENCPACDCGHAADEIDRLRADLATTSARIATLEAVVRKMDEAMATAQSRMRDWTLQYAAIREARATAKEALTP